MKHAEICEKRVMGANDMLEWFGLPIALKIYTPEEVLEKQAFWREDRDWWQKELDVLEVNNESQSKSEKTTPA